MKQSNGQDSQLRIAPVGHSVALLLVVSYILCVAFGLLMPGQFHMHEAWAPLLPGFEWLTWPGFFIGLVEVYLYGWYFAVVFVPLYRWFAKTDH